MKNFTIMATGPMPAMLAAIDALRTIGAIIEDIDICDDIAKEAAATATAAPANISAAPTKVSEPYKQKRLRKEGGSSINEMLYKVMWKTHHLPVDQGGMRLPNSEQLMHWVNMHALPANAVPLERSDISSALSRLDAMGLVSSPDPRFTRNKRWEVSGAGPVTDKKYQTLSSEYSSRYSAGQKNLI